MASATVTIASLSTSYFVLADGADTAVPADVDAITAALLAQAANDGVGLRVTVDIRTPQRPIINGIDTSGA
jgi:hypothetical protein